MPPPGGREVRPSGAGQGRARGGPGGGHSLGGSPHRTASGRNHRQHRRSNDSTNSEGRHKRPDVTEQSDTEEGKRRHHLGDSHVLNRGRHERIAGQQLKERASFHGELPDGGGGGRQRLGLQRSLGPRAESSPVLRRHATVHGGPAAHAAHQQPRPQHQKHAQHAQHPLVPAAGDALARPVRAQEHHGNSRGPAGVHDAPLVRRGSRRLPEVPVHMGGPGRVRVLPRGLRVGVSIGQAEESEEESHQLNYYRRTVH